MSLSLLPLSTCKALVLFLTCVATSDKAVGFSAGRGGLTTRRYCITDSKAASGLQYKFETPIPDGTGRNAPFNRFASTSGIGTSNCSPYDRRRGRLMASAAGALVEGPTWPPTDRLREYVTETNLVDYSKLAQQEAEWLAPVISSLKTTNPDEMEAGGSERHAFLINAYNLWTLHWVIRERRWPWWKGAVSTLAKAKFFYWNRISTGAGSRNLYNFENKDIRPEMNDARVHFALNCASMSCPPLRRKLYTADGLDKELDEVTSSAINGGILVQVRSEGKLSVNPIFKWYKEDFDKEGGTIAFIRKFWKGETPLPDDSQIDFFEYDWRSNSVDSTWRNQPLGGPAP